MARRKTTHKKKASTTHHKRRRRGRVGAISANSKDFLMTTIGGIGGAVIGQFVGKTVSNAMSKSTSLAAYADYGAAGVQIVGAFLLPKVIKENSPMVKGLQIGMAANGGLTLVKKLNIIPGIGAVPMIGGYAQPRRIAGVRDGANQQPVPMVGKVNRVAGIMNMA